MTADCLVPQKQVSDILLVIMPFQDLMQFGEVISGAAVSVVVSAGIDPNPELILDGSPNFSSYAGLSVGQSIYNGISGNIYYLTFTVTTSLSNTYTKSTLAAVINDADQF